MGRFRNIKNFFGSKIALALVILVLVVVVVSLGRESYRKYKLKEEIRGLEAQIEKIEGGNSQLTSLMQYLQTDSYLEKEARIKLNLKKPGEEVVVSFGGNSFVEKEKRAEVKENKKKNQWRWWEYFFAS